MVIIEIIAWNIFIICATVYMAQGLGILLFFLNKPSVSRRFKIMLHILVIIMIIRFNLLLFFAIAMAILGVLETWVPLRIPRKINEHPHN
jgi:hypothetical protein